VLAASPGPWCEAPVLAIVRETDAGALARNGCRGLSAKRMPGPWREVVPHRGTTVEAPAFRPGNQESQNFRPSGPEKFNRRRTTAKAVPPQLPRFSFAPGDILRGETLR
jgi:hypothetical protein